MQYYQRRKWKLPCWYTSSQQQAFSLRFCHLSINNGGTSSDQPRGRIFHSLEFGECWVTNTNPPTTKNYWLLFIDVKDESKELIYQSLKVFCCRWLIMYFQNLGRREVSVYTQLMQHASKKKHDGPRIKPKTRRSEYSQLPLIRTRGFWTN